VGATTHYFGLLLAATLSPIEEADATGRSDDDCRAEQLLERAAAYQLPRVASRAFATFGARLI
jgi:hypothetical protein